ncbi:CBF-domain-containing protein [Violaceomyces palustris]|uniref:CBF-domain-containing protein n=1 Tax=Violaceomyces palustris TaxID=1673888 RepID=A0ACD0NYF5_9BASI|nr:CBF-domain-containing protein [Violaceomyces palustris]
MVRDFRPKGSKPHQSASKRPRSKTNDSKSSQVDGYDDDVDESTLLNEIKGLGGTARDLELISKTARREEGKPALDERAITSEVKDLLMQLKASSSRPESSMVPSNKEGGTKGKIKGGQPKARIEAGQKVDESKRDRKQAEAPGVVKAKSINSQRDKIRRNKESDEVKPKGSHKLFDDGTGTKASVPGRKGTGLTIEPTPSWTTIVPKPLGVDRSEGSAVRKSGSGAVVSEMQAELIDQLHKEGMDLLQQENETFDRLTSSDAALSGSAGSVGTLSASDIRFVRSLLSSNGGGTLSDRISALTLLIQSSPVHNMKAMESLMTMVRKKNREESGKATRALADWLASSGGLGNQKLKYFRDQPNLHLLQSALSSADVNQRSSALPHLLLWTFEDHMKKFYFGFLQALESQSHDPLPFVRKQAVTQIHILLRDKPEQEQNLLRLLVNKLGDSDRSVASKASGHLLELLSAHPAMKAIVVGEVANLILRPGVAHVDSAKDLNGGAQKHNAHARYYGVLTLNQTILTSRDTETANNLIYLYFDLFEGVLTEAGDLNEDEGGNGVEPSPQEDGQGQGKDHSTDKKRWRDSKGKGKAKGKRKEQDVAKPKMVADVHAKMMAAILAGVRRAFPFAQVEDHIFSKHMSTLFRITHSAAFNICIQALQLIFQLTISSSKAGSGVEVTQHAISDRFYRVLYDSLLDSRLASSSKQAMYLNLLFQAMKADQEVERLKAFIKRLCQILTLHQPPFICGALFLLGELFKRHPGLRAMLSEPEDDGDEDFKDVAESDDDNASSQGPVRSEANLDRPLRKYDGKKREPRFANASLTCLWDLIPLLSHFHPSVALHAAQLLHSQPVTSNADLTLNTLAHFLDRFVYRNPKAKVSTRGVSIMQPSQSGDRLEPGVSRTRGHGLAQSEYVNSEAFWKKKASSVPVDQLFFHQFFNYKSGRTAAKTEVGSNTKESTGSEDEHSTDDNDAAKDKGFKEEDADRTESSDDSDEDESEIWEAMKRTMPGGDELDGLDDSDDDSDLEGYDDQGSEDGCAQEGSMVVSDEESHPLDTDLDEVDDEKRPANVEIDSDEEDGEEADFFNEDEDDLMPFAEFGDDEDGDTDEAKEDVSRRKRSGDTHNKDRKERKKRRKALPTFASAEDYAHMLASDDEGDV